MNDTVTEAVGNPGDAGAAPPPADAGSSFLASVADAGTTQEAPAQAVPQAPDTTTAEGVTQETMDGPPEIEPGVRVPEKFWDKDTKQIKSDDAIKAYVNLEKLVGRDKVVMPTSDDDEEGWERVHSAFRPEAPEAYEFAAPEMPDGMAYDDDLEQSYRNAAYANGLHPKQAQALHDMFVKRQIEQQAEWSKHQAEQRAKLTNDLQREHGQQFPAVLQRNKTIMEKYADPDFKQFLDETNQGNDPRMVRFLDRIGRDMGGETKLVGNPQPTAQPADLDAAIASFRSKNEKALMDNSHPDHNRLVAEQNKLFEARYGDTPV